MAPVAVQRSRGPPSGPSGSGRGGARGAGETREAHFAAGCVREVRVHNFMTYADCTFQPGHSLNLILGPNGSGKSSFVCALCIGLAASPKVLGRADSVKEFVKRGEDRGFVEIQLQKRDQLVVEEDESCIGDDPVASGSPTGGSKRRRAGAPEDRVTIRRTLHRSTNSSEWTLNGRASGMREVQDVVRKLNIQIDNLCQFLPQDRVVAFAKLSPEALLSETQEAVSVNGADPEKSLHHLHESLKRHHSDVQALRQRLAVHGKSLEHLEAEKGEMERDVARFQRRQEMLEEKEWVESKIEWVRYENQKGHYIQAKDALASGKAMLKEREKRVRELQKPVERTRNEMKEVEAAATHSKQDFAKAQKALDATKRSVDKGLGQCDDIDEEIENWNRDKEIHLEKVAEMSESIQILERELRIWEENEESGEHSFKPDQQRRLDEVKQMMDDKFKEKVELRQQYSSLKVQRTKSQISLDQLKTRMRSVTNVKAQRIRTLQSVNPRKCEHLFRACRWIDDNQDCFRGPIHGPILAEVKVGNPVHATYLENQVPQYVWNSFVCSHECDRDLLQRELNQKHNMNIDILFCPTAASSRRANHPDGAAGEYTSAFDITHTLDEVFDAAPAVKQVMRDVASIHTSYVGTQVTQDQIEEQSFKGITPQWRTQTRIRNLWTPSCHYMKTVSKYDKFESLRTMSVRPPRLLTNCAANGHADASSEGDQDAVMLQTDEMQRTVHDVDRRMQELIDVLNQLDGEVEILDTEKKELIRLKQLPQKKLRAIKSALVSKKKFLKDMTDKQPFSEESEAALKEKRGKMVGKHAKVLVALTEQYTNMADLHFRSAPDFLKLESSKMQLRMLESQIANETSGLEDCKLRVKDLQGLFDAEKRTLATLKNRAEQRCPLTDESKARFAKLSSDLYELEDRLIEVESAISNLDIHDPNVMNDYKALLDRIRHLSEKVADEKIEFEKMESGRATMHASWINPLKDIVESINAKFSVLFADLGFAGEVKLREAGDDYSAYAIEIWCKFRSEENMTRLTANVQSGGERSVATILYLLALQKLTPCPFRVIDEINQGMDAVNERRVWTQLVNQAGDGEGQCFLLTPKVLPNLPYSDSVTVLNIFNGPYISTNALF